MCSDASHEEAFDKLEYLPKLAGLCTLDEVQESGWSVAESVQRLKRSHYVARKLCETLAESIPGQPVYEWKMLFSHHAYILAEQVDAMRKRVAEMRQPPLGLEQCPHPLLDQVVEEMRCAPDSLHFVHAVYEVLMPWLLLQLKELQQRAHPLADAPTVRLAKLAVFELQEAEQFGREVLQNFSASQLGEAGLGAWLEVLRDCLAIATSEACDPAAQPLKQTDKAWPEPIYFGKTPDPKLTPRRDRRFQDPYNAGVNPEAFLYDPKFDSRDKTLMMYYKRLREIDVPEVMASILHDLKGEEPWAFYHEMVRQLWDEARHAMMGEVGFRAMGVDWTEIPINFTWSLNLNSQLSARERHGVLFFIEQGLMPKTGKRFEWEVAVASGDPLAALFQDFDWADEVLHAQIGQRWYVPKYGSLQEALRFGDVSWSKVMSHWEEYREQGLTDHRNWWPELYQRVCQMRGEMPDPATLAFDENYRDTRADLKEILP